MTTQMIVSIDPGLNNIYDRIISQRVGRLTRVQGFEGPRVRVKNTEKQIHL